ncbi:MAG: dienelactone hydrolase family protein [Burkholderiales bacterium]|nr:dienelactone hydrolase family protein [Burkholderiales bacterium]
MNNHNGESVRIGPLGLPGVLGAMPHSSGLVVFAHGSGSSRLSPRNHFVAEALQQERLTTLLFDLLDAHEAEDRDKAFDIELLAGRLEHAMRWAREHPALRALPLGLFGASTGAAAALVAAARRPEQVCAVVSRGGRPDLAGEALTRVRAPTLLIVGGLDEEVLGLNRQAMARMTNNEHRLDIVRGATHLFEEAGALQTVARMARAWFSEHFERAGAAGGAGGPGRG